MRKVGVAMIGEKIKELRKEQNMTLSELAHKASVAKSYLSSIERNIQSNPSIQFIEKICNVLEMSINDLIGTERRTVDDLDEEWIQIVKEAMASGVSKEQFKQFIQQNK